MSFKDEFVENFVALGMFLAGFFPTGSKAAVKAQEAKYARGERAQTGAGNLVGLIIGVTISAIVGVGVGVPIMNDVIADANLTGTTALIAGFIPVMLVLMVFVATAAPIMRRT
ncbi:MULTISPECIES: hypothetical protein [Halobacterium]|uniref:hypothetical protein n=1 Tax=Halobacterium TaxID=2239 RepID=UPI000A821788|nr:MULTISPECIES: hypothetical protein [Halobacterium]MCG1002870.1 hypothetical protein [Halobacterium noricense]